MWESDKAVLKAYKECYTNLLTEMREGGDVDLAEACVPETNALQNASHKAANWYKDKSVLAVNDRKQGLYTPRVPYFQNL